MTRRLGGSGAILGVTVAVVAIGCGGPTPTGSPAPSTRPSAAALGSLPTGAPCSLIPGVAGAVGRAPIASPNAYEVGSTQRCMWVMGRDPSRYVGLSVGPSANHAATIDAYGDGERVDGLGDDARWWASSRTLSVAAGDRSFQVDLQLDAGDVTRGLAEALARQVLDSLDAGSGG